MGSESLPFHLGWFIPRLTPFLFIVIFAPQFSRSKALSGQEMACQNEGELVTVALVSSDPCLTCYCRKGRVECDRTQCLPLDGCHATLFNRPAGACCDVCRGCTVNGTTLASGSTWYGDLDPCTIHSCQAGVVTSSREQCRPPCASPVHTPGQCCPTCTGCSYGNTDYMSGETFTPLDDPDVTCQCKGGNVTCSERACPVLNCPSDSIIYPKGERCPKCKGSRVIFDIRGFCYFAKKVYKDGAAIVLDSCTSCVCDAGTMMCSRDQCPDTTCPQKDRVWLPGQCCPTCKSRRPCGTPGGEKLHGDAWLDGGCQSCSCSDGKVTCARTECPDSKRACPRGLVRTQIKGKCCPECARPEAKCSIRGSKGSEVTTWDGRQYKTEGTCTHTLITSCQTGFFSVKVRFTPSSENTESSTSLKHTSVFSGHHLKSSSIKPPTTPDNTETHNIRLTNHKRSIELVSIRLGETRIKLYRSSKIRVNNTTVIQNGAQTEEFSIKVKPPLIFIKLKIGINVVWNLKDLLVIKYKGNGGTPLGSVCGMCGNFNGNSDDDIIDKQGRSIYSSQDMAAAWMSGKSCGNVSRSVKVHNYVIPNVQLDAINRLGEEPEDKTLHVKSKAKQISIHSMNLFNENIGSQRKTINLKDIIKSKSRSAQSAKSDKIIPMLSPSDTNSFSPKSKTTDSETIGRVRPKPFRNRQLNPPRDQQGVTECRPNALYLAKVKDDCVKVRNIRFQNCHHVDVGRLKRTCVDAMCSCKGSVQCEQYQLNYLSSSC